MKRIIFSLLSIASAGAAFAETVAITNARIETVARAGTIASGTLVMANGRISAVGADVKVPAGARVIDAGGRVVTPGFIASSTNVTVNEVNLEKSTRDDTSGDAISAAFDMQYGVNPASPLVGVARQTGVTRAVLTPLAGRFSIGADGEDVAAVQGGGEGSASFPALFAGQAAIIKLAANDSSPVVKARAAMALDLGESGARHAGGSRGATLVLVKAALEDARHFAKNRAAYDRGESREHGLSRVDLEALVPVVEGRTPVLIRVSRAADIRQALQLMREEKIKIILDDVEEGWMVADEIASAGVPVIVNPLEDLPSSFEALASRLDNAARLQAAGVLVAIKSIRDFNMLRPVRLNAGTAVANGLPYHAALESITINPARIWHVADRTGSLEAGKDADVVIWSGDPLETTSYPTGIFIAGVEQPDTSRRLQLRDRYLKSGDGYPAAYH
jgi:imidazolonepropionase-like amidohydrolase